MSYKNELKLLLFWTKWMIFYLVATTIDEIQHNINNN